MIAFLLNLYLVFVWLVFIRFKLLPFRLPQKIAVVVAGVVGIFGILIAVNFLHPQSMDARVVQKVLEVAPRTSRPLQVAKVVVEPNKPVKAGDVLFELDSRLDAAELQRLEAALAAAEQNVPQLKAAYDAASASMEASRGQLALAEIEEARNKKLAASSAISQEEYDKSARSLAVSQNNLKAAMAQVEQSRLAYEAKTASGENVEVAQIKAQLQQAKINLQDTVVRAPMDGFVTNLQLQEGVVVAPGAPVMTFVSEPEGVIAVTMPQEYLGNIEVGNEVEICLDMYPGKTLHGTVEAIILASGAGQLTPSGELPTATAIQPAARFPIKVRLNPEDSKKYHLPGGASGAAAIYTNHGKSFKIVRRVMIRWYTWLNYVKVSM